MLTDIKLSKAQLPKIIQSGRFRGALFGKFAGSLMKVTVPVTKNVSTPLATMVPASTIDGAIQRKMGGRGVSRAGKGITSITLNEDMDNIGKSLENSGILIDEVSEIVKHEIKRQVGFLDILLRTCGASMLGNMLTGKGFMNVRKGVVKAGRGYNNMNHMDKNF